MIEYFDQEKPITKDQLSSFFEKLQADNNLKLTYAGFLDARKVKQTAGAKEETQA